jgi:hypothetical protein
MVQFEQFGEGAVRRILIAVAALATLIGTPAFAANMALKALKAPPAPVASWTG